MAHKLQEVCQVLEQEKQTLNATALSQEGELASLQESLVYVCLQPVLAVHLAASAAVCSRMCLVCCFGRTALPCGTSVCWGLTALVLYTPCVCVCVCV